MRKADYLETLDTFTRQYLETLLWSECDEEGEPLDSRFSVDDFTLAALKSCAGDCRDFQRAQAADLAAAGDKSQNGHDFALTRNRHGAGFWDRGYGDVGQRLTAACRPYGPANLYAYRGRVYVG